MSSNTIYDYYRRVSDRFYVALRFPKKGTREVKFIWEPLARKVVIPGFEDFDFFITGEPKHLELNEGLSGSVIIRQGDMEARYLRRCNGKLFIECLPAEIRKRGGRANLNQAIVNFIYENDQEISPRYKVKKP